MHNLGFQKGRLIMEKREKLIRDLAMPIVKTVTVTVIVTILLLLILTLLLYKLKFSDNIVLIGIGIIYFVSNLAGGFIIGKVKEQKRFIWGMAVGITYFVVLCIVSFLVTQNFFQNGMSPAVAFLCCLLGGAVGGMIS